MSRIIRMLLVDDHEAMRAMLRRFIQQHPQLVIPAEAGDGLEALEASERLHPDMVVIDLEMPRLDGLTLTRQIRQRFPAVQAILLTVHESTQYREEGRRAGAVAFVPKASAGTTLIPAILTAAR